VPAWTIPWPPVATPAEEQFSLTLTAGYRTGASNTQYTGFGTISGTPIGTLSPDSYNGITILRIYGFGSSITLLETTFVLRLTVGGAAPAADAFISVSFTDASGVNRSFDRLSASFPNGSAGASDREWTWPVAAANILNNGGVYAITLTA